MYYNHRSAGNEAKYFVNYRSDMEQELNSHHRDLSPTTLLVGPKILEDLFLQRTLNKSVTNLHLTLKITFCDAKASVN
jgi:hypothetical protein